MDNPAMIIDLDNPEMVRNLEEVFGGSSAGGTFHLPPDIFEKSKNTTTSSKTDPLPQVRSNS